MAFAGVDLIARLLVIERKDAIQWGIDPAADPDETKGPKSPNDAQTLAALEGGTPAVGSFDSPTYVGVDAKTLEKSEVPVVQAPGDEIPRDPLTPVDVLCRLLTSPRAVVCIFSTFVYG